MPVPRSKWGTNAPVYEVLEKWVARAGGHGETGACGVPPNAVTVVGMVAGGVALYYLLGRGNWVPFLLCALLRELCDIFDGVLARGCGTGSRKGAILDVLSDSLYVWGGSAIVCTRLWPGRRPGDWVLYALALSASSAMADELVHVLRGAESAHGESWIGRNSILAGPLIMAGVKWYLGEYA